MVTTTSKWAQAVTFCFHRDSWIISLHWCPATVTTTSYPSTGTCLATTCFIVTNMHIGNNNLRSNIENTPSAVAGSCYTNFFCGNTLASGIRHSNNDGAIISGGSNSLFASNAASANQQLPQLLPQFLQNQHLEQQLQELNISSIFNESQQQKEQQDYSTSTESSSQDELGLDWEPPRASTPKSEFKSRSFL